MEERCWTCRVGEHLGGVHPPYWCKPDLCPDRAKHAEQVYGKRLTTRYGGMTRDGVTVVWQIDGIDASVRHRQERCICGLLLIWTPEEPRDH